MVHAISRYLMDFDLDAAVDPGHAANMKAPTSQSPSDDIAAQIAAAEERGRQEGRAKAQREAEDALAQERIRFAEERIAERSKWVADEAERLSSQLATAIEALETTLSATMARVILPFVTGGVHRHSLDDLATILTLLLKEKRGTTIVIRGPDDLLLGLSRRMELDGASIEFVNSDVADVSVVTNDTFIETQLTAWAARLGEAVQSS
ncbi:hypothetical protein AB4072_17060 [Microvirga sp. 2MCAF38]|uniref:hypothetical protein n=1 Tax=Microvirga sp. 2MCAF38 TaxID=3232989 RepID=UPI003F99B01D